MRKYKVLWAEPPGLSIKVLAEDLQRLAVEQQNLCKICRKVESVIKPAWKIHGNLAADHDHELGRVRGLLCLKCNQGLGRFKDKSNLLIIAAQYLEEVFNFPMLYFEKYVPGIFRGENILKLSSKRRTLLREVNLGNKNRLGLVKLKPKRNQKNLRKSYLYVGDFRFSYEDYERIKTEQQGLCKICHQAEVKKKKETLVRLSVDHDHATQRVRGLLCYSCNIGLGLFDEIPDLLRRASEYLSNPSLWPNIYSEEHVPGKFRGESTYQERNRKIAFFRKKNQDGDQLCKVQSLFSLPS